MIENYINEIPYPHREISKSAISFNYAKIIKIISNLQFMKFAKLHKVN